MLIARHVRKLEGYVPGEQPRSKNVVKLNTNENPYPPSPACAKVLAEFDLDRLRRYPDPDCSALRAALANFTHAKPEQIFVGNGSDEILSLCAKTFVENDESIGSLDPSYSLYKTLAAIRDVKWVGDDGSAISDQQSKPPAVSLFLLTNPNAPTGEFRAPEAIARFAKKFKGVVLVDEAYADFARTNCLALATDPKNRNILVMRTFSKSFSLAGLRVGWCVGPKNLIDALYKMKDSYNVDAVAQAVALAATKDAKWMRANVKKVIATRTRVAAALAARGWDVLPSESNFLFVRPPCGRSRQATARKAESIFNALRERNIFVRYFRGPKTGDRLRVTIGTDAQMNKLLQALDELDFKK